MSKTAPRKAKRAPKRSLWRRALLWIAAAFAAYLGLGALMLLGLRWINPPFTAVQVERRIESWIRRKPYRKRYSFAPLARISRPFRHAVVAGEDTRFYQHHGFDWQEVQNAVEDGLEDGHIRGASTITQQLVKNLFLTTWRSPLRKVLEAPLVPVAELMLSKDRILELYVNVVEWGPGVYGAEAAARYHYGESASQITREQGARLAAILPSPLRRKPARMNVYSARILGRMAAMGW